MRAPGAPRPAGAGRAVPAVAAAVTGLALLLRLADLRPDSTFQRTDEVMFVLSSLKLHALVAPAGEREALTELFWMFAFPWGYPVLLFTWSVLEAADALGLPIREFTVIAPFAILGGVTPMLVFLVGRRVFSPAVGLAAAAAVAVLPSHVAQSRTIAAWILASNLLLVVVLTFLRYLETQTRRDGWRFSLALAAYLPSDNLAPGALAFLALQVSAAARGPLGARLAEGWRLLGRREILLLPLLTVLPLLLVHAVFVATGRETYGFIGHYFVGKAAPGLHVGPLTRGLWANGGPALAVLFALGAARGAVSLARGDRGRPVALWLLAFALPTLLAANPTGTLVQGYITPTMLPLILLGAAAIVEGGTWPASGWPALGRTAAAVVMALLVGWTLVSLPARIYDRDFLGFRREPIGLWGGEIYRNDGAKTAGYYIRTQSPPSAVVFSDVRLFVGKYYFGRRTLVAPDPPPAEPPGPADLLALTNRARGRVGTSGYHLAATVTLRGRDVFHVYTREPRPPRVLATEDFDARFDREFGRIAALRYPVVWGD